MFSGSPHQFWGGSPKKRLPPKLVRCPRASPVSNVLALGGGSSISFRPPVGNLIFLLVFPQRSSHVKEGPFDQRLFPPLRPGQKVRFPSPLQVSQPDPTAKPG